MVTIVLIAVENPEDAKAIIKAVKKADPATLTRVSPEMVWEQASVLIQAFEELQPTNG
jgi:hypothetical protein